MPFQCVFVLYPHRVIHLSIKQNKNKKNTNRLVVSRCNSTWQRYGVPMHICHRRCGNNQEDGCHSRSREVKSRAAVPKCISIYVLDANIFDLFCFKIKSMNQECIARCVVKVADFLTSD